MAALSPAALVKAKPSSSAGSLDSLRGAAASGARQAPPSPTSSSSRLSTHDEPPQFPMDTETASSPAESMSRDVLKDSRRRDDDEFAELGVEELINKLPDVLFPFDGEADDGEELTPFKAVYGSTPPSRVLARLDAGGDDGGSGESSASGSFAGSPSSAPDFRFGSAPAHFRAHGFGGRESPAVASCPRSTPRHSFNAGGGNKYQPPNRRLSGGLFRSGSPQAHARDSRHPGARGGGRGPRHPPPVKKNPAPGFNGAGFRSVREVYVSKVHEFLCQRAAFGAAVGATLGQRFRRRAVRETAHRAGELRAVLPRPPGGVRTVARLAFRRGEDAGGGPRVHPPAAVRGDQVRRALQASAPGMGTSPVSDDDGFSLVTSRSSRSQSAAEAPAKVCVPLPARRMPRGGVLSILARVTSTLCASPVASKSKKASARVVALESEQSAPLLVSLERTTTRHAHRLSIILYS